MRVCLTATQGQSHPGPKPPRAKAMIAPAGRLRTPGAVPRPHRRSLRSIRREARCTAETLTLHGP